MNLDLMMIIHSFYLNDHNIGEVKLNKPFPLNKGEVFNLNSNKLKVVRKYWYHPNNNPNNLRVEFHMEKYTPLLEKIRKYIFNLK